MPGIDFARLRAEITMEQVLNLLQFEPSRRTAPNGTVTAHCTAPRPDGIDPSP